MYVMLDLETLSSESNAAIISIGAVMFDKAGVATAESSRFYRNIIPGSNDDFGRHIDGNTVAWWMEQNEPARRLAFSKIRAVPLDDGLYMFARWCGGMVEEMWGNGSDFDNVILANAYKATRIDMPWAYKANRCYRTAMMDVPVARKDQLWAKWNVGVQHHALDDAVRQAHILCEVRWPAQVSEAA